MERNHELSVTSRLGVSSFRVSTSTQRRSKWLWEPPKTCGHMPPHQHRDSCSHVTLHPSVVHYQDRPTARSARIQIKVQLLYSIVLSAPHRPENGTWKICSIFCLAGKPQYLQPNGQNQEAGHHVIVLLITPPSISCMFLLLLLILPLLSTGCYG